MVGNSAFLIFYILHTKLPSHFGVVEVEFEFERVCPQGEPGHRGPEGPAGKPGADVSQINMTLDVHMNLFLFCFLFFTLPFLTFVSTASLLLALISICT